MRSSIPDRSSLFLLRGPQSVSEPTGDHVLQTAGVGLGVAEPGSSFLELCVARRRAPGHPFAAAVSRALTAEDSTFFGDLQGLASLIAYVLPALVPSRRLSQTLRLWSAGCAKGQEAYSLAITLAELCPGLAKWDIEIVASDADAAVLDRAQRGIYTPSEVQRGLPIEWLVRYFEQLPAGGGWRFNSRLAARMNWLRLDPSQSCAPVGLADVILCHQKLGGGELDRKTRRALLGRMTDQLASDGFLILRSPEPDFEHEAGFERVGGGDSAVYRRMPRETSLLSA